jgi:hypothetical protein
VSGDSTRDTSAYLGLAAIAATSLTLTATAL